MKQITVSAAVILRTNPQTHKHEILATQRGYGDFKGGMGIGLYTAYEMAKLHKGDLSYQRSGNLGGSIFTLTLPTNKKLFDAEDFVTTKAIDSSSVDKEEIDMMVKEMTPQAINNVTVMVIEDDPEKILMNAIALETYHNYTLLHGDTVGKDGNADDPANEIDNVFILCETSLEKIYAGIQQLHPSLVVIDSIQTISTEQVDSSPGSISQVRECAASLLRFAKSSGVPVILIGHINKEGTLAGPKILEHIVDTVIQFEGDQHYVYRILRSIKNRFGSTSELGIYEMRQDGLRAVSNPSELLLTENHDGLSGVAISSTIEGLRPFLVETQALVSTAAYGTPQRSATGFDQRRLNMLLAVLEKRVGFKLMQKDVFLNIAGGMRVTDMAMDLSVIAAVLSSNVDTPIENGWCMCGEVGLSGEVRPVSRVEQRIAEAEKLGFNHIILPAYNMKGINLKKYAIQLHPVKKVEEALRALFN